MCSVEQKSASLGGLSFAATVPNIAGIYGFVYINFEFVFLYQFL